MNNDVLLNLIEKAKCEKWTTLDLNRMNISKHPPEIGNLTNLEDSKWMATSRS